MNNEPLRAMARRLARLRKGIRAQQRLFLRHAAAAEADRDQALADLANAKAREAAATAQASKLRHELAVAREHTAKLLGEPTGDEIGPTP